MSNLSENQALSLVHKLLESGAVKLRDIVPRDQEVEAAKRDALYLVTLFNELQRRQNAQP